jgi:hypothetical protein
MAEPLDLAVPPLFRRIVGYLGRLTDDEFGAFVAVLNGLAPELPTEEVGDRLVDVLPPGEGGSVTGLIEFAISTRRLTSLLHADVRTIAAAVGRAAQPKESEASVLEQRLSALLASDFIALREKAQALASEGNLLLTDTRCITDLRPVFGSDGSTEGLDGFLVIHNLKLDVRGSSDKPIYLVLDHDAILQLQRTLERALHKEERLAQLLEESSMRNLSVRSDK